MQAKHPLATLTSVSISCYNHLYQIARMVRLGGTLVVTFLWIRLLVLSGGKTGVEYMQGRAPSVIQQSSSSHNDTSSNIHTESDLFPKRLISVFGLEKSGTTWTFKTFAKTLQIIPETKMSLSYSAKSRDKTIQVQHISQP